MLWDALGILSQGYCQGTGMHTTCRRYGRQSLNSASALFEFPQRAFGGLWAPIFGRERCLLGWARYLEAFRERLARHPRKIASANPRGTKLKWMSQGSGPEVLRYSMITCACVPNGIFDRMLFMPGRFQVPSTSRTLNAAIRDKATEVHTSRGMPA